MKRIINLTVNVLFIIMMVSAGILLLLRITGITAYSVKTPSMYPSCPVGTMLFVAKTGFDDFSEGDIVTFSKNESVITHRVYRVDKQKRYIITKGDNNNAPDTFPVTEDKMIGKVSFYIPYAGYVYIFAETVFGKICLTAFLVLLAVLSVITQDDAADKNEEKIPETDSGETDGN